MRTSGDLYRVLAFLCVVLGAMTIQTTIIHFAPFQMIILDLGLLIVIWVGLSKGPKAGMGLGFAVGLMEDALSGCSLGVNALVKTLIGALSGIAGDAVLPNSPIAHILILIAGSTLNYVLLYLLQRLTAPQVIGGGRFAMCAFLGVLSMTVIGMVLFRLLSKAKHFKPSRVPEEVIEED